LISSEPRAEIDVAMSMATRLGRSRVTSPLLVEKDMLSERRAGPNRRRPATSNGEANMQSRTKSPALTLPGARDALIALSKSVEHGDVPKQTLELVHLRASQINGCGVCVDMHSRALMKMGEKAERIFALAAWREAPYYTDAERAALELTEAATRIQDRADAVPDEVWKEAARHYTDVALASLVLSIGLVNLWNRLNVATKQVGGPWTAQYA
jgi:AhpD family alkylhydroperoxidase